MRLEAVLLHSERYAELADFYRRALGLPEPTPHGETHLGFPSLTPYLGFDDEPYAAVSVWFRVDDVGAAVARLAGLGATRLTPPGRDESPGEVIARMRDPAGHVIGLLADA